MKIITLAAALILAGCSAIVQDSDPPSQSATCAAQCAPECVDVPGGSRCDFDADAQRRCIEECMR